jgi:DNA-binding CsgD family transcriptional regulator
MPPRPPPARDFRLAEADRVLFPALIRVVLGLLERRAGHGPDGTALASVVANVPGEARRPSPSSGEPAWPGEPHTKSETRVLRYLPTHLDATEIAAELYVSADTIKTHVRHLYRKLCVHNRQEAVQRAWVIACSRGPLAGPRTEKGRGLRAERHLQEVTRWATTPVAGPTPSSPSWPP